jgi:hypothetical protein
MAKDFIPAKDSDLINWANNFCSAITDDPTHFGVSAAMAGQLGDAKNSFVDAKAANDVATNASVVATQFKNAKRKSLVTLARAAKRIVDANPMTNDAVRSSLQITIPDRIPSQVTAPAGVPVLKLDFSKRQETTLSAVDSLGGGKKAKPDGAYGFAVYSKVSENKPSGIAEMDYEGTVTSGKHTYGWEESQIGKRVWFVAMWETKKGLRGALGDFTNCIIPG